MRDGDLDTISRIRDFASSHTDRALKWETPASAYWIRHDGDRFQTVVLKDGPIDSYPVPQSTVEKLLSIFGPPEVYPASNTPFSEVGSGVAL